MGKFAQNAVTKDMVESGAPLKIKMSPFVRHPVLALVLMPSGADRLYARSRAQPQPSPRFLITRRAFRPAPVPRAGIDGG
jgi:hypothetical protein